MRYKVQGARFVNQAGAENLGARLQALGKGIANFEKQKDQA